ncbi:MAG: hypothetical protein Q9213_002001 [Squamulea squamosa]
MTKRKKSIEKALTKSKPRKQVAFSIPKASTKAIIVRNASTSPLLRLPPELRNRIWTEVLGKRLIHLSHIRSDNSSDDESSGDDHNFYGRRQWTHLVCQHDCPEDQPDRRVVDDEDEEEFIWEIAHYECDPNDYAFDPYLPASERFCDHLFMHLNILRVSRQVYVESNQVLWTTNTFSFDEGTSLKFFLNTRNIGQRRLIRNLRFQMDWRWGATGKKWNSAVDIRMINSLTGLRTLRLKIFYDVDEQTWSFLKDRFVQVSTQTEGLRRLSTLPLITAEVVVRPSSQYFNRRLWQKIDSDQCARDIQRMLLNPQGEKIYADHQRELRETRERCQENKRLRKENKVPSV